MPDAPAPGCDLSRTTMSSPEPTPRVRSSFARWYAVERPWMPAPTTTYEAFLGSGIYCLMRNVVPLFGTRSLAGSRDPHEARRSLEHLAHASAVAPPAHRTGVGPEDKQADVPLTGEVDQSVHWSRRVEADALDVNAQAVCERRGRLEGLLDPRRRDVELPERQCAARERHLDCVDDEQRLPGLDRRVDCHARRFREERGVEGREKHGPCGRSDGMLVRADSGPVERSRHSGWSSQVGASAAARRTRRRQNGMYQMKKKKEIMPATRISPELTKRISGTNTPIPSASNPNSSTRKRRIRRTRARYSVAGIW